MSRFTLSLAALFATLVVVGCTKKVVPVEESAKEKVEVVVEKPDVAKKADVGEPELGPQPKIVKVVIPPQVKSGEAVYLDSAKYDWREWRKASSGRSTDFFVTVDEVGEPWYINWDADRKPFDMIVIHHSDTAKDATAGQIEKIQKGNLYEPRYKDDSKTPFVKGLPVHSGHVVNGKERFIAYHHLVYWDGKVTTELSPLKKVAERAPPDAKGSWEDRLYVDHVGWHAGNWSVNCRSVAICLVGNFNEEEPPEAQLEATRKLIEYYRSLTKVMVTGHYEHTKKPTDCPGTTWPKWRRKIEE